MRKTLRLTICLIILLFLLTGCRDVLSDDRPFTGIPGDSQITTTSVTTGDSMVCGECADEGKEGRCEHKMPASVPAASLPCSEPEEVLTTRPKKTGRTKATEPPVTTTLPKTTQPKTTQSKTTQPKTTQPKTTQTKPATSQAQTTTKAAETTTTGSTATESVAFYNESYEHQVVALVNAERAAAGLSPLEMNKSLWDSARVRAEEITRVWGHKRPDGRRFATAIKINYCGAGENIAAGQSTPERVVRSWMDSPSHRDNILNPNFKWIGVGCYYDYSCQYKTYWSQLFVAP